MNLQVVKLIMFQLGQVQEYKKLPNLLLQEQQKQFKVNQVLLFRNNLSQYQYSKSLHL